MDSEHRHELKTNELAQWIADLPDFCRRNISTIIGIVLVAAAVLVYVYGTRMRNASRFEQQAKAISLIRQYDISKMQAVQGQGKDTNSGDAIMVAASQLEMGVDQSKTPHVSALLLIKQGEALRADLHYKPDVDVEIKEERIKEARKAYEKALPLAEGNPTLVAMAQFGLGLCAEEIGDYILAEKKYNEIISDPDFQATVFPTQARQRLEDMADNKIRYEFVAAAPEPQQPDAGAANTPAEATTLPASPASSDEAATDQQAALQAPPPEPKKDDSKAVGQSADTPPQAETDTADDASAAPEKAAADDQSANPPSEAETGAAATPEKPAASPGTNS